MSIRTDRIFFGYERYFLSSSIDGSVEIPDKGPAYSFNFAEKIANYLHYAATILEHSFAIPIHKLIDTKIQEIFKFFLTLLYVFITLPLLPLILLPTGLAKLFDKLGELTSHTSRETREQDFKTIDFLVYHLKLKAPFLKDERYKNLWPEFVQILQGMKLTIERQNPDLLTQVFQKIHERHGLKALTSLLLEMEAFAKKIYHDPLEKGFLDYLFKKVEEYNALIKLHCV